MVHSPFGHGVGICGCAFGHLAHDRANIDHASGVFGAGGFQEQGQERLCQVEHALHIEFEKLVPSVIGVLAHRCAPRAAGVVHQDVKCIRAALHLGHESGDALFGRHITAKALGCS